MSRDDADILSAVREHFQTAPPGHMAVAVSGGSDSVALLHILNRCFAPGQVALAAATVDHGLRPASAREARDVAQLCARMGVPHTTLCWTGWSGEGNLQDQARRARYSLLSDWAKSQKISVLALGHTADDQAETVLMRLARSAGVTGLSAMPPRRTMHGITMVRPLLELTRQELREYLQREGLSWVEDPSNADPRFDRIKARQALPLLAPLGIDARTLADVAHNMAQAREALDWYTFLAARDTVHIDGGNVIFDLRLFRTLPDEIARRLLVRAIMWVSGSEYAPRRAAVSEVLEAVRAARSATLGGCRLLPQAQLVWVCREYNAVRCVRCPPDALWDRRWRLRGPDRFRRLELRALGGPGLAQCAGWRETGRPRAALTASPAVWQNDELIAAPLAGKDEGWRAEVVGGSEEFFASLLSH